MKVYSIATGEALLTGRCEIPDGTGDVYEVPLFGAQSVIMERFRIGEVNTFRGDGTYITERGVLLWPGQAPDLLPNWQPLAS
jgi:hypothetical protein